MRPSYVPVVALVVALLGPACSSGRVAASRSPTPAARPVTAVGEAARRAPSAAPTIRMFAGVQSALGVVASYCARTPCPSRPASTRRLTVAAGSIVTFAVQPAPDRAALAVDGTRVSLATGTLLAYQGRLPSGWHRLTLQLTWGATSGTWVWDVAVAAG